MKTLLFIVPCVCLLLSAGAANAKQVRICGENKESKDGLFSCRQMRSDADLDGLEHFTKVNKIDLSWPTTAKNLKDSSLEKFASSTNLAATVREIIASGKRPTSAGWQKFFAAFPELEVVKAGRTSVDDDTLAAIAKAKNLKQLVVGRTAVSCAGLAHFAGNEKLKIVDVWKIETPCTDKDVDTILKLKGLKIFKVRGADFSDEALERLSDAGIKVME
ncbi:MAG: hypothetical protein AAFP04_08805 [Myxococcota bacterium]